GWMLSTSLTEVDVHGQALVLRRRRRRLPARRPGRPAAVREDQVREPAGVGEPAGAVQRAQGRGEGGPGRQGAGLRSDGQGGRDGEEPHRRVERLGEQRVRQRLEQLVHGPLRCRWLLDAAHPAPARDLSAIRTALVCFGHAGRVFHGPHLADDVRYRLDTIGTSGPERVADAARRYPAARLVPDGGSALATGPPLVVVASRPAGHVPGARAAVAGGGAVVVDRPFCAAPAEGRALAARAAELGRALTVFHNRRWDSEILTLQRLLAE